MILHGNAHSVMTNIWNGYKIWTPMMYISLTNDPDFEQNFMIFESGNGLFALDYIRDNTGDTGEKAAWFSTYDPKYLDSDEETDIKCSDGQSVILRKYAITDKDAVMTAIEYFIHTGKLWNGIQWIKEWREWYEEADS